MQERDGDLDPAVVTTFLNAGLDITPYGSRCLPEAVLSSCWFSGEGGANVVIQVIYITCSCQVFVFPILQCPPDERLFFLDMSASH